MIRIVKDARNPALSAAFADSVASEKVLMALAKFPSAGPSYLLDNFSKRLNLEEAELACSYLNRAGYHVQPYDFPYTKGVWQAKNEKGIPYYLVATDQLLASLAERLRVDRFKPSGFRELLPFLTVLTFREYQINNHCTRLQGVLNTFSSSPSAPILELINTDSRYHAVKKLKLDSVDFPEAANNSWRDKNGQPTKRCTYYTKLLIQKLAKKHGVNAYKPEGFKVILQKLDQKTIAKMPVNYWGTTLASALKEFDGSPSKLVLKLVNEDSDFISIKKVGLNPYDFPRAPNSTWIDSAGKPSRLAHQIIREFVKLYFQRERLSRRSQHEVVTKLCRLSHRELSQISINFWGTTIRGALDCAFKGSLFKALKNLNLN